MPTKIDRLPDDHFLIKELVESYVEDWKERSGQRDHQKRWNLYASDVSKCDRAIYYDFKCPENKRPISPKTLMFFNAGNIAHDDIQARARKRGLIESGRDIEYGLEIESMKMTGRLDFIAAVYKYDPQSPGLAVVEIKTKNDYNFGEDEPTQDEIDQLLLYIDGLKNSASRSVKKMTVLDFGFILYAARSMSADPLPLAAWKVEYNPERAAEIRARFTALYRAIEADAIPQRPYERDSLKCSYCRYAAYCWEGVPVPAPAVLEPNLDIEAPEYELVESMAARYIELKAQAKKLDTEIKACQETFRKYFQAKGITEIPVNGSAIVYAPSKTTTLDVPFLYAQLKDLWFEISAPKAALIQKAIKDGRVDPEIFERAKLVDYDWEIRIKKAKKSKEENNANQGTV
jgi:CRISPR/Cas system-associated exonuclease Cas4 (RecB family)